MHILAAFDGFFALILEFSTARGCRISFSLSFPIRLDAALVIPSHNTIDNRFSIGAAVQRLPFCHALR